MQKRRESRRRHSRRRTVPLWSHPASFLHPSGDPPGVPVPEDAADPRTSAKVTHITHNLTVLNIDGLHLFRLNVSSCVVLFLICFSARVCVATSQRPSGVNNVFGLVVYAFRIYEEIQKIEANEFQYQEQVRLQIFMCCYIRHNWTLVCSPLRTISSLSDRPDRVCGGHLWEHAAVPEGRLSDRRSADVWVQTRGK